MNTTEAIELIIREPGGTLTEAESRQLHAWRSCSLANQQTYHALRQLYRADWSSVADSPGAEFFSKQQEIVRQKMVDIDQRQHHMQLRFKMAAVLVLGLLASVFVSLNLPEPDRVHLKFVRADIATIADALEEEYNVRIEVEETARHLRFTGDFVHQDIEVVLKVLTNSMPLTLKHRGDTYVLVSRQAL